MGKNQEKKQENGEVKKVKTAPDPAIVKAVVTCKRLNVRENPSIKAKVLITVSEGDVIRIIETGKNADWFRAVVNDVRGYVMKEYVKEIED